MANWRILMIEDYLKTWNEAENPKPCNDPVFIKMFVEFIGDRGSDHFEFSGDNGYCGYTAVVYEEDPRFSWGRGISFEFAYGLDFVKVFTAQHCGYWVPEYINLQGGEAATIIGILNEKFIRWGGFAV